jgi:hypothetical protein
MVLYLVLEVSLIKLVLSLLEKHVPLIMSVDTLIPFDVDDYTLVEIELFGGRNQIG